LRSGVHQKVYAPPKQSWPQQVLADVGSAEDVAPTEQALYWLSLPESPTSGEPETVAPYRYDEATHQITAGPSITGYGVGDPAITVTGGWVWVIVGRAKGVEVAQYDPQTMALHSEESLPIAQIPPETFVTPILSATVDGPLWVGAVNDLWALDPSTGAVETAFDAGYSVLSMSTDPTGTLLYVGGRFNNSTQSLHVSEYDADTGRQLEVLNFENVSGPTVAATTGGVWVSSRSGMAGGAVELSAGDLKPIAGGGTGSNTSFGPYDQIMGVASAVSDEVLWLQSVPAFTCADPITARSAPRRPCHPAI
jgi:hypothetical protein